MIKKTLHWIRKTFPAPEEDRIQQMIQSSIWGYCPVCGQRYRTKKESAPLGECPHCFAKIRFATRTLPGVRVPWYAQKRSSFKEMKSNLLLALKEVVSGVIYGALMSVPLIFAQVMIERSRLGQELKSNQQHLEPRTDNPNPSESREGEAK